ncbi:MAG TPA: hypothetical protein DCQ06_05205, partial [Myxococcales bacterium]|nr:hypothetical protein [Myxococcales bacterium]
DGLAEFLQTHRIDAVVLQSTWQAHQKTLRFFAHSPDWWLVHVENEHSLFVRRPTVDAESLTFKELSQVPVSYDPAATLSANRAGLQAELQQLQGIGGAELIIAWNRAVLAIEPVLRRQGLDGMSRSVGKDRVQALAKAHKLMSQVAGRVRDVPTLQLLYALVSAHVCDLNAAELALRRGTMTVSSRQSLFTSQEIALRRGDAAAVQTFVGNARAALRGEPDAWVSALQADLRVDDLRCDR